MSDKVYVQLGLVQYMCGKICSRNISLRMDHGVLSSILDSLFEGYLEVVRQTHNRILLVSPVEACHEVLLPQVLMVPWRAEFPFAVQIHPVCTHMQPALITRIAHYNFLLSLIALMLCRAKYVSPFQNLTEDVRKRFLYNLLVGVLAFASWHVFTNLYQDC